MVSESPAIQELRRKIVAYLEHDGTPYRVDEHGSYIFRYGTTLVFIQPLEWHTYTLVKIFAPLAFEITRADRELAYVLTERNFNLVFGKLSLDLERRSIWLEHVLLGDFLDADELLVTLDVIAATADQYDEQIATIAGGKRIIDMR